MANNSLIGRVATKIKNTARSLFNPERTDEELKSLKERFNRLIQNKPKALDYTTDADKNLQTLYNTLVETLKQATLDQMLMTQYDNAKIGDDVEVDYYTLLDNGVETNSTETLKEALFENGVIEEMFFRRGKMLEADIVKVSDEIDTSKASTTHTSNRGNNPISYLIIHYTAGASSKPGSALRVCDVFQQRPASADFIVDDGGIVQYNPDIEHINCWAIGDAGIPGNKGGKWRGIARNKNSVSIEVCSNLRKGASASKANHNGWYFTEATINNAIKLSRMLMSKYNIPKENVIRHYDVTGKMCPGVPGWNLESGSEDESTWLWFKSQL